eukprot:7376221-Prymnesium_polylepis.1
MRVVGQPYLLQEGVYLLSSVISHQSSVISHQSSALPAPGGRLSPASSAPAAPGASLNGTRPLRGHQSRRRRPVERCPAEARPAAAAAKGFELTRMRAWAAAVV